MDIQTLIGETTEYDKKAALEEKKPKSWLKSVSAFANGIGGQLFFGISDDDTVVGLADAKTVSEKISQTIKDKMDPLPKFVLSIHDVEGKQAISLKVLPGQETPYYYIGDGNRIAFVRIGNESVPADAANLMRLVLQGAGRTFDSLISRYKFDSFAFTKLKSVYKIRTGSDFTDTDYLSFGLVAEDGFLTNAGALFADDSPIRHSRLFCTRWNGLDKAPGLTDALDDKEFSGSLISLLQDGQEFVKNNTKKRWRKTGNGREEMPEYPEQAVFECLVNALIHRDYLALGSEVHIDIFDDRMEIYSPGGMIDGSLVQERDIDNVPSQRRNPIIADLFSRMHFMERRGSGFKKIKGDYTRQVNFDESKLPLFQSTGTAFFVTLYNLNYGSDTSDVPESNHDDKKPTFESEKPAFEKKKAMFKQWLSASDWSKPTTNKIAELYSQFGDETDFGRSEIMKLFDISSYSAGEIINKLKTAGLITAMKGKGKGRYHFTISDYIPN